MRHAQSLGETREIVTAMKSLAFIETRRLDRFLDVQREVVRTIEDAAGDFLGYYPDTLSREAWPGTATANRVFLLMGSERGFCGNFNEALIRELERQLQQSGTQDAAVIACGNKLSSGLAGHPQLLAAIAGAAVADEIEDTLARLVTTLSERQRQEGPLCLRLLYHEPEQEAVSSRDLLPPFAGLCPAPRPWPYPPQLNLPPQQFLLELVDLYLFSALHEALFVSLMAENQSRLRHLEGAVRYLDENLETLRRRANRLRQEEITEEIEVILLSAGCSAGGIGKPPRGTGDGG